MKRFPVLFLAVFLTSQAYCQFLTDSAKERQSLDIATAAIRDAFARGDAAAVVKLHHPNIIKYFGGQNVVIGRAALEKGLTAWFENSTVEFVENNVESTIFSGTTAIQTVIFAIKTTPKKGGAATISRGRSMVVYVRDKNSPTGWLSLREMAQEAPEKN